MTFGKDACRLYFLAITQLCREIGRWLYKKKIIWGLNGFYSCTCMHACTHQMSGEKLSDNELQASGMLTCHFPHPAVDISFLFSTGLAALERSGGSFLCVTQAHCLQSAAFKWVSAHSLISCLTRSWWGFLTPLHNCHLQNRNHK